MKTRSRHGWLFGMVLAVAWATTGCAQEGVNDPSRTNSSHAGKAVAPIANTSAASLSSAAAPAASGKELDPAPARRTPLSPWAQEIQKLVKAGVDERVITSYITNAAGFFNLNADQIISLKSAGVSPEILSVMIQHDRQLFPSGGVPAAPAGTPASLFATLAASGESSGAMTNDAWSLEPGAADDYYYAPEQPESIGPVRAPYAVKLNDPIVVLRLPTFTVPCW